IHTNGIENFWGLCKSRLTKNRGIDKKTFILHIKECEFRYNHRHENLFNFLLKNFRKKPLKLS
ncbi:MAG: IS1595 family transposase, partial [Bacteroidales bacterium]|nr:IS1595 family transposase [Bacteroidales bacterium]